MCSSDLVPVAHRGDNIAYPIPKPDLHPHLDAGRSRDILTSAVMGAPSCRVSEYLMMAEANPFEVQAEQLKVVERPASNLYGSVNRLRFFFWTLGSLALVLALSLATTLFLPGFFALFVLPLFSTWLIFFVLVVAARLRNAGWTSPWRFVPTGLLVPAVFVLYIQNSPAAAAATSLLAAANLPVLVACLIAPTAWTQHKTFDLPARMLAAVILLLLVLTLLRWLLTP